MAAGGKRLRPAFCHWAYIGAGGSGNDDITMGGGQNTFVFQSFADNGVDALHELLDAGE